MRVLGINAAHDSSLAIAEDGKIIFAIEEECLTGIKKYFGFPARALLHACELYKCNPWDFDKVMIAGLCFSPYRSSSIHIKDMKEFALYPNAEFVDHHYCHALSAYAWSGWDECMVMTADGGGDNLFATIYECKNGKAQRIAYCSQNDDESIGLLYNYVTEALGFTPNKHEGKVMGLSAHGKPSGLFDGLWHIEGQKIRAIDKHFDFPNNIIQQRINMAIEKKITMETMAADCQKTFEEIMFEWINTNARGRKLAVAGGCFANVILNMKIAKIVDSLFVVPSMFDSGNSVGAALAAFDRINIERPQTMYLGLEQKPRAKNQYKPIDVAQMIAAGKVIGLFQGKLEFGPRALGNRSILCDARNYIVFHWLNTRLERTEFMPFAPVILEEYADELLIDYQAGIDNGPFMTTCWKVKPEWWYKIPAVIHVDSTARPQIIKREENPYYYDIIEDYRQLTGIPAIINTSFNAHEDPIICWQKEADWALATKRIDILVEN